MTYAAAMIQTPATPDLSAVRAVVRRALPGLRLLYVFGSRARGDARPDSDLDLAVLADGAIDPLRLHELRLTLGAQLDCDVDLVDLDRASTVLKLEVIRDGIVLEQQSPQQTLAFEARVLSEHAELLDATRALREDIRQRGTVYAW